jgi:hypothetical protein
MHDRLQNARRRSLPEQRELTDSVGQADRITMRDGESSVSVTELTAD